MKIEICEQMVQSWLQHIKGCQVVQTNWMLSPLYDFSSKISYVDWFMKDITKRLNDAIDEYTKESIMFSNELEAAEAVAEMNSFENCSDESMDFLPYSNLLNHFATLTNKEQKAMENIFGQSTAHQFVVQCEVDVVGIKFYNEEGNQDKHGIERIYLVDSAFHKGTLGYGNAVARVLKKLIRASLVSEIVFGNKYPIEIAFATPDCSPGLYNKIQDITNILSDILKKYYSPIFCNIEIKLYFNETFSDEIYLPLKENIDVLNNDNDLFMRSLNLAKAAEMRISKSSKKTSASTTSTGAMGPTLSTPAMVAGASSWSDFEAYAPAGYRYHIEKIMVELDIKDIYELEKQINDVIDFCTTEIDSAKKSGDNKRAKLYTDRRAALRKYKEFMNSKKILP